jgi:peptidoglycan/LPS O-acetylase OafA/YrhL
VVVGHLISFWAPNADGISGAAGAVDFPTFGLDYLSPVTLFFIISGFTLVQVYDPPPKAPNPAQTPDAGTKAPPLLPPAMPTHAPAVALPSALPLSTPAARNAFWRKRVARLAPVYYFALLLGIAPMVVYKQPFDIATSVPLSLLWLQSITIIGNQWVGPLWTVSAFAVSYLHFPKILACLRPLTTVALVRTAWALQIACIIVCAVFLIVAGPLSFVLHAFAYFRLLHFSIGVAAGYWAQRTTSLRHFVLWGEALSLCLFAHFVLSVVIITRAPAANFERLHLQDVYSLLSEFLVPIFHAAWIAALTQPASVDKPGTSVALPWWALSRRALSSRPLKFLGDVSYSLYCVHWPVFNWCAWAVAAKGVNAQAVPVYEADGRAVYFFPSLGHPHHCCSVPSSRYPGALCPRGAGPQGHKQQERCPCTVRASCSWGERATIGFWCVAHCLH